MLAIDNTESRNTHLEGVTTLVNTDVHGFQRGRKVCCFNYLWHFSDRDP